MFDSIHYTATTMRKATYTPSVLLLLLFFSLSCQSRDVVSFTSDSLTTWQDTTIHVGESVVFMNGRPQRLYLFHNRRAFLRCMFDQAAVVHQGTATHFQWQPSRPGYYYFSTRAEGSQGGCDVNSMKVQIRVITPDPSPDYPSLPTPAPTSGSDSFSTPATSWMLRPPAESPDAGAPAPEEDFGPLEPRESMQGPATAPTAETDGNVVPFISSNPAVPIPMGETDTASFQPLATTGSEKQVTGAGSCFLAETLLAVLMVMASSFTLMVDGRLPLLS